MKKSWIIYVLLLFVIPILLVLGVALYLYANQQEIKNYALTQLNEQLTAEVVVETMKLDLFEQFPQVSLDLEKVIIEDPTNSNKKLLETEHVYVGFNLFDIIRKSYNIKQLTIENGIVSLAIAANGKTNFSILKPTNSKESGTFLVNLKEVQLNNVEVIYTNLQSKQWFETVLTNISLNGNFSNKGEVMNCKGMLLAKKIKTNNLQLFKNKLMALDISLDLNHQTNTYTIKKGNIDIDKLKLDAKGSIVSKTKSTQLNLTFGARELNIQDLMSLIPAQINLPDNMISKGQVYFSGSILGEATTKTSPKIAFKFGVKNGELNLEKGIALQQISLDGELNNGTKNNAQTSYISLKNVSCKLGQGYVKGDLVFNNFIQPNLNTNLVGELNATDLLNFIGKETIEQATGTLRFDFKFNGLLANLNKNGWLKNSASGSMELNVNNLKLKGTDKTIQSLNTALQLANADAKILQFDARIDKSDVKISGTLNNLVPYLLVNGEKLTAKIDYASTYIDLNHFMVPTTSTDTTKQEGIALPTNIEIDARLKANQLVYQLFAATNVQAAINWAGKSIQVSELRAETMGGSLKLNGQIDNANDGRFLISTSTQLNGIDITQLFKACGDFGQQEITQKHLKGKLTGEVTLASVWSKDLVCDLNKLYVLGKITISNGELNNYEPLNALGKFVDVNELRNLKFADLSNSIEIKNKTIYIPQFDIKNNALNLTVSGTHTFENMVDYHMKIKLSELLKNKRRANKPATNEFNEEEPTPDKGANLYLSMKGPINNVKITYDKVGTTQKIKQELKQEKQNIKEILKKELGISSDSKEKDKDIKEKKNDNDELEFEPE